MQYLDRDVNQTSYELKSGSYKKDKILGEGTLGKVLRVQKISTHKESITKKEAYYFNLKINKRIKELKKGKTNSKDVSKTEIELENKISFI